MLAVRVVPCLDVANGRVVKGTRFVDLGGPPGDSSARGGPGGLRGGAGPAAPRGRGGGAGPAIADRVPVPVVASGGAAGPADFVAAVRDGGASAVLAASIFHRRQHSIAAVKAAMAAAGIPVRPVPDEAR